jgi:MFS family permease
VYPSIRSNPVQGEAAPQRGTLPKVGATVLALGSVSLLTDVSSEMITAVLPIYLTLTLGLSPFAYGILDGIYQGVTVLVRLLGGYVADKFHRPKATAEVGYGLSAVCKLGLLAVSSPAGIGAVLAAERTGKGLRTAPRDALISASVRPETLGRAFGVHRAMDTAGAMAGPLLAFALLLVLPGDYDSIFLTSFAFAALGVAVLATFVRERPSRAGDLGPPISWRALGELVGNRRLRTVTLLSGLLGLLTVSDSFLYLSLRDHHAVEAKFFPLLFFGTAAIYLLLAIPVGRLADRVGRGTVLVGGHALLLFAYVVLLSGSLDGTSLTVAVLCLLGAYYACTDGVLAAIAASLTPEKLRGSGIALAQTAVAGGRLLSAMIFGLLWSAGSQQLALTVFAIGLLVALPVALRLLRPADRETRAAGRA